MFWCSVNNGLIKAIGFNKTSVKYDALYFVQPLFDYRDYWVLEYGDTLVRRYSKIAKELLLYRDFEEMLFNNNIENVKKCFEKEILDRMNRICDINSLCDEINGDFFFCGSKKRLRLAAYSALYSKKYAEAEMLFKEYIETEKKEGYSYKERISEPQKLLDLINNDPDMAYSVLTDNVVESRRKLKI